jgi:hypothetical protein
MSGRKLARVVLVVVHYAAGRIDGGRGFRC